MDKENKFTILERTKCKCGCGDVNVKCDCGIISGFRHRFNHVCITDVKMAKNLRK